MQKGVEANYTNVQTLLENVTQPYIYVNDVDILKFFVLFCCSEFNQVHLYIVQKHP